MGKRNFFIPDIHRAIVLVILLTALVYANSLKNSFVWDDYLVIVNNDFVKSWKHFPLIFKKAYLSSIEEIRSERLVGSGETSYRPIVTASYFIDYSLWKLNPFGYHLSNVLLHVVNAVLFYLFVLVLMRDRTVALLASLFFALHPVNTEAVAVISFREDILVFLFFISAFLMYILSHRFQGRRKLVYYFSSVFLFTLALFSKEMAITLPLILIVYDYLFVFDQKAKSIAVRLRSYYLGYLVTIVLYGLVWLRMKGSIGEYITAYPYPGGTLYTSLLTTAKVIAQYIGWLIFPVDIHATFPETAPAFAAHTIFEWGVLSSAALIVLCGIILWRARKTAKEISFGIAWFFITLIPTCNIFPISDIIASRYLYLPIAGFAIVIATFLRRLPKIHFRLVSQRFLQKLSRSAFVVILVFYAIFTGIRNMAWNNNMMLWLELAERYPRNPRVQINLGHELSKAGLFEKAIRTYETALRVGAPAAEVYNYLGKAYGDSGMLREAADYFRKAVSVDPRYVDAYNNLAITLARQKQWGEARLLWLRILQIAPDYNDAKVNLEKLDTVVNSPQIGGKTQ